MNELITALKAAFSSEYAFYLKAQNFHWNVQGDDFYELHLLFERIYNDVAESIDPFAENIRKLQAFVPATFGSLNALSIVDGEERSPLDCTEMLQELLQDSENMCTLFANVYELADANRKFGLANFLADRQDAHDGYSWLLRSQLVPEDEEDDNMTPMPAGSKQLKMRKK